MYRALNYVEGWGQTLAFRAFVGGPWHDNRLRWRLILQFAVHEGEARRGAKEVQNQSSKTLSRNERLITKERWVCSLNLLLFSPDPDTIADHDIIYRNRFSDMSLEQNLKWTPKQLLCDAIWRVLSCYALQQCKRNRAGKYCWSWKCCIIDWLAGRNRYL